MFPAGTEGIRAMQVALADGVTIRVAESGSRGAPPVLLVHGWGASIYMWRAWFAPLAAAGYRVVALDLPGHGLSDKPSDEGRYRLESLVSSVREVIAHMRLRRPHVVAQSMGGTIALELAVSGDPHIGRLVLVNPACFGNVKILPLAKRASPRVVEPVLARLVPRWVVARGHRRVYGDPSLITEEDIDQYWAPSQFPGYAPAMRRLVHEFAWKRPPVSAMVERLRALVPPTSPPLAVLGTRDRLVRDARSYAAALRKAGAPLEIYASVGGGHAVNEERPRELLALVLAFLERS
ncbi:MAG TPA: alpha/beta fold hydrolase [Gemmatimonadaceae bacterium]|nr:alpha/beta fold hydrolase [Gemmatimonadaceae bacterium]